MANIPNARQYTAVNHRRPQPQPQPAPAPRPAAEHRGWIIGLALVLAVLIALLVAVNHPWLAIIGAAASGAGITHILQR